MAGACRRASYDIWNPNYAMVTSSRHWSIIFSLTLMESFSRTCTFLSAMATRLYSCFVPSSMFSNYCTCLLEKCTSCVNGIFVKVLERVQHIITKASLTYSQTSWYNLAFVTDIFSHFCRFSRSATVWTVPICGCFDWAVASGGNVSCFFSLLAS